MKLRDIAERLSCSLDGDGEIEIGGVAAIDAAAEGDISFLVNPKYRSHINDTRASALIVGYDFNGQTQIPLLRHNNPYFAFAKALEIFNPPVRPNPGTHSTAWVSPSAVLGHDVFIGAYSCIGEKVVLGNRVRIGAHCTVADAASIGDDSVLHAGCSVRERVVIGKRVILQDRVVIGADGFGYAKQDDGVWYKIVQTGTVVIEDDVEIGAGSAIDRASLGDTRIGQGTKIDNLVHVGHGCQIGRNCLLCAQVGLAGSTKLGDNVILAGQVGAAGHLTIGDGVVATAQSGIPSSVEAGKYISGSPAVTHQDWLKSSAIIPKLPELRKLLNILNKRLKAIEKTL
ncbi:MAG TPA: UDP-3-O-(3-hydroxymyristoyl)glucosamine N-acyltransferase [Blastocatellia bacterium]|nr:UDP-3-O-(3-hydroxymyristoyl)glucosamine N-acyltransferase [Blastocatellia bacterium]